MVERLAHARQVGHQLVLVPGARGLGAAQLVIDLLGLVHDVGQVLQAVGPRIALDGVHVAEQLGQRGAVGALVLADDAFVLVQEAGGALDEIVELVLADRQDLADHLQAAALLVGLRRQRAQLGDVAHAEHQAHDGAGLVGDRRPGQVQALLAAVRHALADLVDQQVLVELEVDAVLAETGVDRRVDLRAAVRADVGIGEHQLHHRAAGDIAGLEDALEEGRVLAMHGAAGHDGQDALLHVLQHRLDVGGALLELGGVALDRLDHAVEGDDRAADLVHPAHRHAAREVLARGDLAHHLLHAAERAHDLAIEHQADGDQHDDHHAGHGRNRHGGGGEHAVERRDRLVLLAVLLDAQRLDDALQLVAILGDVGEQVGLGQLGLAVGLHPGGVVDRVEVVLEALAGLVDQPGLGVAGRRAALRVERGVQRRFLGVEFGARLRGHGGIGRVDERHRRDLDVLDVGDEIRRCERAGHHALRHLTNARRAALRLINGVAADRRQRDEHQRDKQRNAMSDGHVNPRSSHVFCVGPPVRSNYRTNRRAGALWRPRYDRTMTFRNSVSKWTIST